MDTTLNLTIDAVKGLAGSPTAAAASSAASNTGGSAGAGTAIGTTISAGSAPNAATASTAAAAAGAGGTPRGKLPRVTVTAVNVDTKLKRSTAAKPVQHGVAYMRESLKISIGNKEGLVRLEVCFPLVLLFPQVLLLCYRLAEAICAA